MYVTGNEMRSADVSILTRVRTRRSAELSALPAEEPVSLRTERGKLT